MQLNNIFVILKEVKQIKKKEYCGKVLKKLNYNCVNLTKKKKTKLQ